MDSDLLTLSEAAELINKSVHNISYLINYKRIKKYNFKGNIVTKIDKGVTYVSKTELLDYWNRWNNNLKSRRELLQIKDEELAFSHISEKERTKHVHRLHPYLGKFIPQLVEYYLKKNFTSTDVIMDPFMGSGTTLTVASELGLTSIGIDISEFNCSIARAKLTNYNIERVKSEINEIYYKTEEYSNHLSKDKLQLDQCKYIENEYLTNWFSKRSLLELLFYKDDIKNYQYQDILKIILTRAARSSRLVHHYDIATPKKPVIEPYICRKHQDKICYPIDRAIGKLRLYSFDTKRRLEEFSKVRKTQDFLILHGDSRSISVEEEIKSRWGKKIMIKGIFTSPPYVGQIDYHEQHRYAYELLDIDRYDEKEIGPKKYGKGKNAQIEYQIGISEVFRNVGKALDHNAKIFIVANDKFNLYSKIIKDSGLKEINSRERPVESRTEGDKTPYSEKVFECKLES